MNTLNTLTVARKGDREKIAAGLIEALEPLGVEIERREGRYGRRDVDLRLTLNGVGASVWINADLGDGHHLISWFNTVYPSRDFTPAFNVAVGDLLQFRPHHKATSCADGWDDLRDRLVKGFGAARSGHAFIEMEAA